jgi:dynein heavy chain 1
LCKGVFGGRITNEADQKVLDGIVCGLFVPKAFNVDFQLVPDVPDGPTLPDVCSRDEIFDWIHGLPSRSPPTWVGLDSSAEIDREKRLAESVSTKIASLQEKCDADSSVSRDTKIE